MTVTSYGKKLSPGTHAIHEIRGRLAFSGTPTTGNVNLAPIKNLLGIMFSPSADVACTETFTAGVADISADNLAAISRTDTNVAAINFIAWGT